MVSAGNKVLEKLKVSSLDITAFYATRILITMFTKSTPKCNSLFWAESPVYIHPTYSVSIHFNIISPTVPCGNDNEVLYYFFLKGGELRDSKTPRWQGFGGLVSVDTKAGPTPTHSAETPPEQVWTCRNSWPEMHALSSTPEPRRRVALLRHRKTCRCEPSLFSAHSSK